ncbi:uncharacterized protein LOC114316455 [Camellia sinensis]|uniref:uncharacterized protein LOC114316455 n=1 Tax=Camellia sinensis TaxID=4442 RepID=UPI001036945A|nr:uncharacterized protein LOC114316455 [Camellia sinensis]
MTLKRNYPSGFAKRKKKQRVEKLVESQRGAINKFFTGGKQTEQSVEDLNSEEFETLVNNENENLVDNENENLVDEEGNGEFGSTKANQDDEMNIEYSIAKSEAKSLVTHELETFEFLFSIVIWYNLLFHVNSVSKLLQSEDMDIAVAVKQLDGLVKYVAMYREVGFMDAMVEAKEMASELGIEPTFVEKHIISRKKQFDENVSEEVT